MRIITTLCILVLVCGGCNNKKRQANKVEKRAGKVAAIKELKQAVKGKNTAKLKDLMPPKILRENYIEDTNALTIFNGFFDQLDLDRLMDTIRVSGTKAIKTNPCAERYDVSFAGDSIVFEYRMEQNEAYELTVEDIDDEFDQSSYCEHLVWFNFRLKNGQLILTSAGGAD